MSNLDKLNAQFNMKNVDTSQFMKALSEQQNSFIKLFFVVGSLVLVVLMFNDHHTKDRALHDRLSQLQDKLEVLKNRDIALKDLSDFKSSLPKRQNQFELIMMISNYAKAHNITITSLSPAELKDMGLYDVINVSFDAVADDFKDMMLFIRTIEKSKTPLRIDTWSGHEGEDGKITFDLEINAVLIHP
jgi:hypothetical protein